MNVGIDLVKISRFKELQYTENESFYKKNFSDNEIKYCLKFNEPYKHFAGKFAIKEAVIKSIEKKNRIVRYNYIL
jgi:holo-[acyl-carrier protein] synthase